MGILGSQNFNSVICISVNSYLARGRVKIEVVAVVMVVITAEFLEKKFHARFVHICRAFIVFH